MTSKEFAAIKDVKQRQIAFWNDTLTFYDVSSKCCFRQEDCKCLYAPHGESPGCAIGRFMKLKDASFLDNMADTLFGIKKVIKHYPDMVPSWMRVMDVEFLTLVQSYHDELALYDDASHIKSEIEDYLKN